LPYWLLSRGRILERRCPLEQIADASIDGTRKELVADLATGSLLIVDDLDVRKLPHKAAEDRLEVIRRRYEQVSTILTSSRPLDDWASSTPR
jgi:DNA replication protein DnaC